MWREIEFIPQLETHRGVTSRKHLVIERTLP